MGAFDKLSDSELFDLVVRTRAKGEDASTPLGSLCERWRKPAGVVVRRVQQSYRAGSPDDEGELYQEAVRKLIERGLDQFRGLSEARPGAAASPKTFFLRIVKHAAIDAYRRQRELLDSVPKGGEEDNQESPRQIAYAINLSKRAAERDEAQSLYWTAFDRLKQEHPNEAGAWDAYHHQDLEDHEACAKKLGITVANSYKRVSRAQAYLRRYLQELMDG
ncbi:MAG TPA: sigma-70 family RNA polymerase sigma factor [Polyangiaceae bacterium]|jgi:RNA polymerase sigma-70 factor (ECF subfamily)